MAREFREETGVSISKWTYRGEFSGDGFNVKVFRTITDRALMARTMEDERVTIVALQGLPVLQDHLALCPHVKMLVELCLNDRIRKFNFEEE